MIKLWFLTLLVLFSLLPPAATQCKVGQVQCGSICGTPCDGLTDCPDRYDESLEVCRNNVCNSTEEEDVFGYSIPKFRCAYGGCISETFVCNGQKDCWDQSDETPELCSSRKCTRRQFKCDYGACIRKLYACNGNSNCLDKSDETVKQCKSKRCRSTQFKCDYGACIDMKKRCDGSADCFDNSDESEEECGAGHTTEVPIIIPPTPSITTSPPKPPVVIPPTSKPGKPDIVFGNSTPPIDWCMDQGLCSCPKPNEHFCVPCQNTQSCSILGNGAVCSIKPAGGPFSDVKVEVLTCGIRPVVCVAGYLFIYH